MAEKATTKTLNCTWKRTANQCSLQNSDFTWAKKLAQFTTRVADSAPVEASGALQMQPHVEYIAIVLTGGHKVMSDSEQNPVSG